MQLTTVLSIAVVFFLFTATFMMYVYSRYDMITGDEEGKVVLLIMACLMGLSSFCFGGVLIYCL